MVIRNMMLSLNDHFDQALTDLLFGTYKNSPSSQIKFKFTRHSTEAKNLKCIKLWNNRRAHMTAAAYCHGQMNEQLKDYIGTFGRYREELLSKTYLLVYDD